MKLYNYWRSSASWRVRIALALKGVKYEYIPVHLLRNGGEHLQADHLTRNPMAQVPVLEVFDDPKHPEPCFLSQSMAILEYLEDRFPSPSLLPARPLARAQARQIAEMINAGIQPYQGPAVAKAVERFGGDAKAWRLYWIEKGLAEVQQVIEQTTLSGDYCIGNSVSMADLCLIPQLYAAKRFGVDTNKHSILTRIEKHCEALPPFQAAHPSAQPDAEG